MQFFSLLIGKLSAFAIQAFFHRNASTWPGHLVLESNPNFIRSILKKNPNLKIVLIAGTNGKTTTTKALHHILEANGISVIRNDSGANLLNGFASLLIRYTNLNGKINKDALLFEVDENSLPLLLENLSMANGQWSMILLNLFRDQLDRYGEINTIAERWKSSFEKVSKKTHIIANADDPQIVNIATGLKNTNYFSINDKLKTEKVLSHAVDSTTCPNCFSELKYSSISYSHIGDYKCPKCSFTNPNSKSIDLRTNLKGTFNHYNLTAAVLCANQVFKVPVEHAITALKDFKPAFGRQEELSYKGKNVMLLLSKNPTGFNESLKIVKEKKDIHLLIVLNDRIPDGRDISWIWDVDFELLSNKKIEITVSGDRTYDIANRLHYAGIKNITPVENLKTALNKSLSNVKANETLVILPTYSAMLEIRKLLTGKSIL